jgi:hypothetical protein
LEIARDIRIHAAFDADLCYAGIDTGLELAGEHGEWVSSRKREPEGRDQLLLPRLQAGYG